MFGRELSCFDHILPSCTSDLAAWFQSAIRLDDSNLWLGCALGNGFRALWSSNQCQFNAFAALLVDVSDEDNRSKLVGIVWSMLMVGIIVGQLSAATC